MRAFESQEWDCESVWGHECLAWKVFKGRLGDWHLKHVRVCVHLCVCVCVCACVRVCVL